MGAQRGDELRGSVCAAGDGESTGIPNLRGKLVVRLKIREHLFPVLSAAFDAEKPRKPAFLLFEGDTAPV